MQFNPQKAFRHSTTNSVPNWRIRNRDVYSEGEKSKVTHLNAYLSVSQDDIGSKRARRVFRTRQEKQNYLPPTNLEPPLPQKGSVDYFKRPSIPGRGSERANLSHTRLNLIVM